MQAVRGEKVKARKSNSWWDVNKVNDALANVRLTKKMIREAFTLSNWERKWRKEWVDGGK